MTVLGGCLYWPARANELPTNEREQIRSIVEALTLARWNLAQAQTALTDSQVNLEEQGRLLKTARQSIETLSAKLADSETHSAELAMALESLGQELETLKASLGRLTVTYNSLLTLHTNYSQTVERQIAGLERRVRAWRAVGISALALALAATVVAVVR